MKIRLVRANLMVSPLMRGRLFKGGDLKSPLGLSG